MLKLDKTSYKDLDIYNIGYVTVKEIGSGYDINSVNPLYLRIDNASGYIEDINEDKYLVFDVKNENKEKLHKTKFNSDDNLPLNKLLKFYQLTLTIRFSN